MPEFIVLKVKQDDYTVGKLIENHLYAMYRSDLEFVGFEKEHATKKEAYIYIKYMDLNEGKTLARNHLRNVAKEVIQTYQYIQNMFR